MCANSSITVSSGLPRDVPAKSGPTKARLMVEIFGKSTASSLEGKSPMTHFTQRPKRTIEQMVHIRKVDGDVVEACFKCVVKRVVRNHVIT